ncbi:hypothetical protein KKA77_01450 [Patescibacteria group bacterium]|nr:hypothetical protein [Patescibacteria group bacterium]
MTNKTNNCGFCKTIMAMIKEKKKKNATATNEKKSCCCSYCGDEEDLQEKK